VSELEPCGEEGTPVCRYVLRCPRGDYCSSAAFALEGLESDGLALRRAWRQIIQHVELIHGLAPSARLSVGVVEVGEDGD
jgi:hypothetical protein